MEGIIMPETKEDKTKILWLAKRLTDVAKEFDLLEENQKKVVIERADNNGEWELKSLYESINEYMGW